MDFLVDYFPSVVVASSPIPRRRDLRSDDTLDDLFVRPRPSSVDDLNGWLCASKAPFGGYLGEIGGIPDCRYARLDAEYEQRMIQSPFYTTTDACQMPKGCGVYAVYYENLLVYVGTSENLRRRCAIEHTRSVQEARKVNENEVLFRVVETDKHARKCIESRLIEWYEPDWNKLGFGRRPGTSNDLMQPSAWDIKYGRDQPYGGERQTVMRQSA